MPTERPKAVTLKGTPHTLVGPEIKVGARAPEFSVIDTTNQNVNLAKFDGKTRILLSVHSLDTSVCDAEAREFSKRVKDLPNTAVIVVSMDLPAAQRRWCGGAGADNITVASDHREASFGLAYGVLIKELRLLSRAAFVVNPAGEVTHVEYVPEVGQMPNGDAIVRAAKEAERTPA